MGKKGPPYLNNPHATFIVIDHPWGQQPNERNSQVFINRVGAWVRFMPRTAGQIDPRNDILVQRIYTRKTEDMVIVELPEDVPLSPYLGEHRWQFFLKPHASGSQDPNEVSTIFEYNYRGHGNPANHNWTENYPITELPPPHVQFPVQIPYPQPTFAERSSTLTSITKPMPKPPTPTPEPEAILVKTEEEEVKPSIKIEDTSAIVDEHHPSASTELIAAISTLPKSYASGIEGQGAPRIKPEPVEAKLPSETHQPSEELLGFITEYNAARVTHDEEVSSIKPEPVEAKLPFETHQPQAETLKLITDYNAVRTHDQRAPGIKSEPVEARLPLERSYDPRKRPGLSKQLALGKEDGHKKIKLEPQE